MDLARTAYRVHQCSKCPGNTGYYCKSCPCYLCQKCKEKHVTNFKIKDHYVAAYRDKFFISKEFCVRHPSNVYIKYCETCQVPLCDSCVGHQSHIFPASVFRQSKHRILSIEEAYKTKQEQHRGTIYTIRSEALFYRLDCLPQVKADFKTCRTNASLIRPEIFKKAPNLKDLIDKVLLNSDFIQSGLIHRFLKQKIDMIRHIVGIQICEHIYEQNEQNVSTFSALQFLSSIKTAFSHMHLTLNTSQLSMTESLNKEEVMESVCAIIQRKNRRVRYEYLLKLMSGAEFLQSLTVTGVGCCFHISFVTSDLVWVSDRYNLILTNTKGVPLHRVKDSTNGLYSDCGLHTVNSETELIYIDRNYNINKLSKDMKKTTTFIKSTDPKSIPQCVYWSPSTGDLLVGMYTKVSRYNKSGQLTQTIPHDNTGWKLLYLEPKYITENNNGDVVVSDYGAVVVTEHGGRHRFSYTGHPSGSELKPVGICTDALSHILVCDSKTKSVQILDRDGQFLSFLMIRPLGIRFPLSLSYDVNTHCLLVGSGDNNKVVIYRYIINKDDLTATADAMESLSEIPTTGTENPQQGNQSLLMSPPELPHSSTLTVVNDSYISFETSGRVCLSDEDNLNMTNTAGVLRNHVEGLLSSKYGDGFQTVNSDGEHIYIDTDYSIKKASKDKKTTTTLMRKIFSKWRPRCVYWSPSTGDLLVGMYREEPWTGKVTRYNQSGKLIQTIQHDNTELELYKYPTFITENNNGDVVVSDKSGAVVVTERGGRHRFSYIGHPPALGLQPYRICTDALSHIMVYDYKTNTVHLLNKDGQFLSHVRVMIPIMFSPYDMSCDVNTHRSRDRSRDNIVSVQRNINRKGNLGYIIYKYFPDKDFSSLSSTSSVERQDDQTDGEAMLSSKSSVERQDDLTDEETHFTDGEAMLSSTDGEEMSRSTSTIEYI